MNFPFATRCAIVPLALHLFNSLSLPTSQSAALPRAHFLAVHANHKGRYALITKTVID